MTPAPMKPTPETTYAMICGTGIAVEVHADIDECGSAQCHQRVGPQSALSLPILTLGSNQSSENECAKEANERVDKVVQM